MQGDACTVAKWTPLRHPPPAPSVEVDFPKEATQQQMLVAYALELFARALSSYQSGAQVHPTAIDAASRFCLAGQD